jgi:hypothetical protein
MDPMISATSRHTFTPIDPLMNSCHVIYLEKRNQVQLRKAGNVPNLKAVRIQRARHKTLKKEL